MTEHPNYQFNLIKISKSLTFVFKLEYRRLRSQFSNCIGRNLCANKMRTYIAHLTHYTVSHISMDKEGKKEREKKSFPPISQNSS